MEQDHRQSALKKVFGTGSLAGSYKIFSWNKIFDWQLLNLFWNKNYGWQL
jgi:hypothetical protein